ncbi:U4/U6.U5 tri-snRNP-associated protein 2 isoform X2 [Plutella xylostella]|uniref:U4/U6.U5 tri-snRNP-associated protein 2 isoform X1 n=1 Tax=Plutella xylostella TaxID=51655 RepID=UPI0020330795|nr:U4/U6.U5 tri-snRNP-associated protein 2 isoform X1 [Plutella xylostella]XP_048481845.1 U4/U6.U5 tri-snRNP-associated protein 2 isoform X2 [Plutella xylostella]
MSVNEAKKRKLSEGSSSSEPAPVKKPNHIQCPYLDTINRHVLDFDFEKLCSVSLTRINVYACLVCGKYFQGRGTNTHAYTHSVADSHHVFLNLHTLKFYCLPDNYEVIDSSLNDIKYVLNPIFESDSITQLDFNTKMSRAIDGTMYMPGIVGLNNIKANDYCNVILQCLSQVRPLRNYFLREENYADVKRPPGDSMFLLVQRFGELLRKLWNPRAFKAHVSPHEMLQAVVLWSKKRFQFIKQSDPIDFLSWFLNSLHMALNGTKKPNSSIIYKSFLGHMKIYTRKLPPPEAEDAAKVDLDSDEYRELVTESPFLYLTCDLPPTPLFTDEFRENIIPQVNLYQLLSKFNGQASKEYKTYKENFLKRFEITELPPYLILYIKRFTKNTFFVEKNPTVVNFPVKNVDFGDILTPEVKAKYKGKTTYELVGNILHDGTPEKGTYRCHVLHKPTQQWYEMQDLHVTSILPQMITLTEAYIQIYELKQD